MRRTMLAAAFVAVTLTGGVLARQLAVAPANSHFERTWQRTDLPVLEGQVDRSWMWGPEAFTGPLYEDYAESPDGRRVVQYYDKSRMELTHPGDDPNSVWYVTNGLLVVELVTGRMQAGDSRFVDREPAQINVAGDFTDPDGPTYATMAGLLDESSFPESHVYIDSIDRAGNIIRDEDLLIYGVQAGPIVTQTRHTVAQPFWDFIVSAGQVYESGQYTTDGLFKHRFFATGLPITEAYWTYVLVEGTPRHVLLQCFERRCLTYAPDNREGWRVEAGNVGRHYYEWRYGEGHEPPVPAPMTAPTATVS